MSTPQLQGEVTVTYQDGHQQTLEVTPIVAYWVAKLEGLDEIDQAFVGVWVAAGRPGMNGEVLTSETAVALMLAWLESVKAVTPAEGPRRPPTGRKRR